MKLFFCDICNESIPLQDIKENRSTTIKGKIFCRNCNPLNELASEEPKTSAAGRPGGGALAVLTVLVLACAGAVGYLLYERFAADDGAVAVARADQVATLESEVDHLRLAVKGLEAGFDSLVGLRDLPARLESLREEEATRGAELARVAADMRQVQEQLVAVGNLRDRVEGVALRQDEASRKIDAALSAVDGLRRDVDELVARPPVIVERDGGGAAASGGAPASAPADDEQLRAVIEKLSSNDAMARWEGVDQIRRRKDPALAGHVIPLLDDRDTFVRAQAIYTLGELKAAQAVPKLVKLLRDDEDLIRSEALTSLVVITGQPFKFDVNGSKAVRDKGVRQWEEWLDKNRDKFGT